MICFDVDGPTSEREIICRIQIGKVTNECWIACLLTTIVAMTVSASKMMMTRAIPIEDVTDGCRPCLLSATKVEFV